MSEAKSDVQAAPAENLNENPNDEVLKTLREELKTLFFQRRTHRSRLLRFQRAQKTVAKNLPEQVKDESEEKQKQAVKNAYQVLRSFCFAFNGLTILDKEAEKFFIPDDFEAELKEVLTADYFSKFEAAIKASKEDYPNELPATVSEAVVEKLLKFISVKQTNHIVIPYEEIITSLTEKIDPMVKERDNLAPPREKKEKKEKVQRRRRDSEDDSREARLQDILREVSRRSDSVHLSKDDHAQFSEAQAQLDTLLHETVSDIMRMKQTLKKRFDRAQNSQGRYRSSSKRRN